MEECAGRFYVNNASSAISACNNVPDNFKGVCFNGFGNSIMHFFSDGNADVAIRVCDKIPLNFKNDCFLGLNMSSVIPTF